MTKPIRVRVRIVDRAHPHYPEIGVLTGDVIEFKYWKGRMALVKLDTCAHGGDSCYVSPGQVERLRD